MDNRSPGFTEVNSFRKKTKGIVPSIRQYLQEANKKDSTKEELLVSGKLQSTASYVRTARKDTNTEKTQDVIIISDTNESFKKDTVCEQTMVNPTIQTEVKIKQEMIDMAIVASPFQSNELSEVGTDADLLEMTTTTDFTNKATETLIAREDMEEDDGVDEHGEAPTNTYRRPWDAAGSRKKLRKYYEGISRFQDTVVFEGETNTQDASTDEEGSTEIFGSIDESDDLADITDDTMMELEEPHPMRVEESLDDNTAEQGARAATNDESSLSLAASSILRPSAAASTTEHHFTGGTGHKSVSTGTEHFPAKQNPEAQAELGSTNNDGVADADSQATAGGRISNVRNQGSQSSVPSGILKQTSATVYSSIQRPTSFPPSRLHNSTSDSTDARRHIPGASRTVTGRKTSFHGHQSPKNYTPQMPRNEGYNFTFNRRGASGLKVIAKATESVKDKMAFRGRYMVEQDLTMVTSIKVEFNLSALTTEYNVRAQFIHLLELFKKQDPTTRVQCSTSEVREWDEFSTLPEDAEFNDCFQLVTKIFRKHKKVIVHCTILTEQPLNRVKYAQEVKDYIFHHNIWIKVDRYDSKDESSPGFFVMIHPKLINREDFTSTIVMAIKKVKADELGLSSETNGLPVGKSAALTEVVVPEFHLELSQKKWGKLRTEVIRINCALDDAEELKSSLSSISERNLLPSGIFVPVGIHLISGPDVMTQLLKEHVTYIANIRGIPITGISPINMDSLQEKDLPTVREQLLAINSVLSVERTRDTSFLGKWIVLTNLENEEAVLKTVTMALRAMQQSKMISSHMQITAGRRSIRVPDSRTTAVHTYADALTKKFVKATTKSLQTPVAGGSQSTPTPNASRNPSQTIKAEGLRRKPQQSEIGHASVQPDKQLQNRFAAIEQKWQNFENRISLKHEAQVTKLMNKLADKLQEDNRNERDRWSQTLDKKIEDLKQGTDNKLSQVNDTLGNMVDKHLENQFDKISMKVAEHVTIQLMKILSPRTGQAPSTTAQGEIVTQETAPTPTRLSGSVADQSSSHGQKNESAEPPTEAPFHESNEGSTPTCSPHDNNLEHMLEDI